MNFSKKISLDNVIVGQRCVICQFDVRSLADRRLADLGFVEGTELFVVGKSFANANFAIKIRNSVLCIRKKQAKKIWVNI